MKRWRGWGRTRYVMFYEGVAADGSRAIGLATSKDGIRNWQRYDKPVLEASLVGWDSGSVGVPCAMQMAGKTLF